MTASDPFFSSDATRSAAPLRHARIYRSDEPLALESGAMLPDVTVCYETWGTLSPERDNAVLVCHAISGDSHAARHDADDDPGWWDVAVGPGRPIDTNRYFVICANVLGGCRGTTGPNFPSPGTGEPYGADFPTVTVGDMVEVERRLIDHLGIARLRAVVGGSLGGFQALEWALRFPDRVAGCIGLATAPRLTSQAIAFDVIGRNAIVHDPRYRAGRYYDAEPPASGLAIARMLAHVTYLSSESMERKFDPTRLEPRDVTTAFEKKFSVGSYLAYQGEKFVERFDANSYITLSMAMDLFDLGATVEELRRRVAPSSCRWLLVSFSSDWLYPAEQSRLIVDALIAENKPVSYCNITSACGHDAFLLPDDADRWGRLLKGFLHHVDEPCAQSGGEPLLFTPPSRVDAGDRIDLEYVLDFTDSGASVLDLGCGRGELLELLRARGCAPVMGVELDEHAVVACVERGLDVIHADIDRGLSLFGDNRFDIVILSQTLQTVANIATLLDELVRVGRYAIVSFPNFAYRPLREMFYREGKIPKTEGLYGYEWYDSPNRRFPTIVDFEELCATRGIRIDRAVYLDTRQGRLVDENPNLNADVAVVRIAR